jgi:ferredoxin--NADP+ reductase/benzoate/toluate 1,2-dioxygenase reductase subunit
VKATVILIYVAVSTKRPLFCYASLRKGIVMNVKVEEALFLVDSIRHLTGSTYVLRFSRNEMQFKPGQHLVLGLPDSAEMREYSIYSGIHDDRLEILIKEVDHGLVSRQLKSIQPGEHLEVRGPYGFFLSDAAGRDAGNLLFLSSGTGIAPFHSYIKSYPDSDYRVILGVRHAGEAYDARDYKKDRLTVCTSRGEGGDYQGRLTDYLLETPLDPEVRVYLCGNSHMIYDAMDILHARGIPQKQIFTEVYF